MPKGRYLGICLAALAISVCYGFFALFSTFVSYDDEGVFLVVKQLYLEGYQLYRDIFWPYGPAWLALPEVVHGWLGVPLTHTAARFLTLLNWLMLAFASGLLVRRLTGSGCLALATFLGVFVYTDTVVNEPGHPQGLIALLTVVAILLSSPRWRSGWGWLLVGTVTGVVFNLKINAGVFILLAATVLFTAAYRGGSGTTRLLHGLAIALSVATPFLLMWPHLSNPECSAFATLVALAAMAVSLTLAMGEARSAPDRLVGPLGFGAGFLLANLAALGLAAAHGVSVIDIYDDLRHYRGSQVAFWHFFREYSVAPLGMGVAALICSVILIRNSAAPWLPALLNVFRSVLLLVLLVTMAMDNRASTHYFQAWVLPWCWLCLWEGSSPTVDRGRQFLACTAVFSPLLSYPLPGSQVHMGSFLLLPAVAACARDLFDGLAAGNSFGLKKQRRFVVRFAPGALLAMAFLQVAILASKVEANYRNHRELGLPGTRFLRLGERQVNIYRELVAELDRADVALMSSGFNSLYLWSAAGMPAPVLLSHSLAFLPVADQQRIRQGLENARAPVVVSNRYLHAQQSDSVVIQSWIDANFEPVRNIGPYALMRRIRNK